MSDCRQCGRRVPGAREPHRVDARGLDMGVIDQDRLFCTMRCAARYGVQAASATPSQRLDAATVEREGEEGCSVCNGDCGAANPPPIFCPMRDTQGGGK